MNLRDVDTQRVRYDFLIVDSFATRAELKLAAGELDAARMVLEKAAAAFAVIRRFSPELENADERKEIEEESNQLRTRLDTLHRKMHNLAEPADSKLLTP